MGLFLKAILGAVAVILIALLSKTKNYYLAGLVPLFPTFALIAHVIIGKEKSAIEFKETLVFGMCGLIPYFFYLFSVYVFIDKFSLSASLFGATIIWVVASLILILLWNKFH